MNVEVKFSLPVEHLVCRVCNEPLKFGVETTSGIVSVKGLVLFTCEKHAKVLHVSAAFRDIRRTDFKPNLE